MIDKNTSILRDVFRVLVISPHKGNGGGEQASFWRNSGSKIKVYQCNLRDSALPENNFDMALFHSKILKKGYIKKMQQLIGDAERSAFPVFGVFDHIPPRGAIKSLKHFFSDIRCVPSTPEKLARYITLWSEYIRRDKVRVLKKKRLHWWLKKARRKDVWIKKEITQLHTQLSRIRGALDSMELWHQQRRLERELKIAHSIQSGLLPKSIPVFDGYDFDAVCMPAREIGGDFFDFYRISNSRLGFVIGDVATRGIPAALVMTEIRGMWRTLMVNAHSPQTVVSKINMLLYEDLKDMWGMFVSLFCGIIDRKTKKLIFTNAGHSYPVLYRPSADQMLELKEGGKVLGIKRDAYYQEGEIDLHPGDLVVCYTDGISECHQHADLLFGKEKLYKIIKQNWKHSVKYIKDTIFHELDDFLGMSDSHDDRALVLFKCKQVPR